MKIGLYFGSFNPVHIGHMAIANYFIEFSDLDRLWFVISPHNPLKEKKTLLNEHVRMEMVELAINNDPRFMACDIEFHMPKPSYTIDTLAYLKEKYPKHQFVLIMGSDGLKTFSKWKNHEEIIKNYPRYVYPRDTESNIHSDQHKNIRIVNAPKIEISSTFVRNSISERKDIRHFLPQSVFSFIDQKGYYL